MSALKETLKDFDAKFPIGTPVSFLTQDGKRVQTVTWSHAGLGKKGAPSVFVDAIPQPVPLANLKIEGHELVYGKKR